MPNIKIVQKGFETYNGFFDGVKFENGLSTEPMTLSGAEQLGASIKIVDADTNEPVSVTQRMINMRGDSIKPSRSIHPRGEEPKVEEKKTVELTEKIAEPNYTREQLEALADSGGISKLREFAKEYNVNGKSIASIIDALMKKAGE